MRCSSKRIPCFTSLTSFTQSTVFMSDVHIYAWILFNSILVSINALANETIDGNFSIVNYEFFSYDILDHRTLLVKFDLTKTIFFQHQKFLYNGHLFISKIPSINKQIIIDRFVGTFETEVDGTITDHFTFCLVLQPIRPNSNIDRNISISRLATIYDQYLLKEHFVHFCTKLGPDEDRHRHRLKQGSEGDRVLLVLQLLMIIIFLMIFQIVHSLRARKVKQWRERQYERFRRHKRMLNKENEVLNYLQFIAIDDENNENDENEESFFLSPGRTLSNHSPSMNSLDSINANSDTSAAEHILRMKHGLVYHLLRILKFLFDN